MFQEAMIAGILTIFAVDMIFGEALVRYVPLDIIATSDVPQLVGAKAMFGTAGFVLLALATICSGASAANSHMASVPGDALRSGKRRYAPKDICLHTSEIQ